MEEQEEGQQPADIGGLIKIGTPFNSKNYIDTIKTVIKEGLANPLDVYVVLKRMNKVSEEIFEDKEIREIVLKEADKYLSGNQKSFKLHSATICKTAVHTWYDFKSCGHIVLDELYKIKEEVEAHIKHIESELKLLVVDERKPTLGIAMETKDVAITRIPKLEWMDTTDTITVQAPKKIQKEGLKFMKI